MNKWLQAELDYWQSQKSQSLATLELYFNDSVGIGEHSDITESVVNEIEKIARWQDVLHIIEDHFE